MRILVVEDDAKLRQVLHQGLGECGFAVETAATGPQGLGLASHQAFDAIVLDLSLPGMDGLDVCRELRSHGVGTPVLMLTARSSVGDRVRGLDLGADDYLPKPFDFQELLARLRAIARRPPVVVSGKLRCADLELDPARHEVRRAGRPVSLTAREFALLEYLVRNKDIVVTQSMILQRVWGSEHGDATNLVPVYVNYLRKKIDHGHGARLIHTVRGVGYVLREAT